MGAEAREAARRSASTWAARPADGVDPGGEVRELDDLGGEEWRSARSASWTGEKRRKENVRLRTGLKAGWGPLEPSTDVLRSSVAG